MTEEISPDKTGAGKTTARRRTPRLSRPGKPAAAKPTGTPRGAVRPPASPTMVDVEGGEH